MIYGNVEAELQVKCDLPKNGLGEVQHAWVTCTTFKGYLDTLKHTDYQNTYNAKIIASDHILITDSFVMGSYSFENSVESGIITSQISDKDKVDLTSENTRILIDGVVYEVKLIDDPMGLHQHLEIYLHHNGFTNN